MLTWLHQGYLDASISYCRNACNSSNPLQWTKNHGYNELYEHYICGKNSNWFRGPLSLLPSRTKDFSCHYFLPINIREIFKESVQPQPQNLRLEITSPFKDYFTSVWYRPSSTTGWFLALLWVMEVWNKISEFLRREMKNWRRLEPGTDK